VKYCTVALVLEGIPPPPPFSVESAEGVDIYRAFEQLSAKLGVQMHKLYLTVSLRIVERSSPCNGPKQPIKPPSDDADDVDDDLGDF
jgi:hypothetical protein